MLKSSMNSLNPEREPFPDYLWTVDIKHDVSFSPATVLITLSEIKNLIFYNISLKTYKIKQILKN